MSLDVPAEPAPAWGIEDGARRAHLIDRPAKQYGIWWTICGRLVGAPEEAPAGAQRCRKCERVMEARA